MSRPISININNSNSNSSQAEMSYSMIVDKNSPTNNSYACSISPEENVDNLSKIQSRQRKNWVDDNIVQYCFSCKVGFTMYIRSHHCRKCGNVFCYKCSEYRMVIPEFVGDIPAEPYSVSRGVSKMIWSTKKVRVCNECAKEILQLKNLQYLFRVFDLIPLTVQDYRTLLKVDKTFNQVGNYYLSKFREIQYKLPYQQFNQLECRLLNNNKHLLVGHSLWETAVLRSGMPSSLVNSKVSCRTLMCSRVCNNKLSSFEAITLLSTTRTNENADLLRLLLTIIQDLSASELICYIPLLIQEMLLHHYKTGQIIGQFLINQSKKDILVAGNVYWGWKIKLDQNLTMQSKNILQSCQKRLLNELNADTIKYLEDSEAIILFLNSLSKGATLTDVQESFRANKDLFTNIRIPTCPQLICKKIEIDKIKIKESSSRPIFLPLECYDPTTDKNFRYYLLYKFEDIRQDQIVINTIRMMEMILKKELKSYANYTTPMKIITYNIFPTSKCSGLIEIIPDCHTLFEIQQKFTIFNYILENNGSEGLSATELRNRFLQSSAAYCVMTYLLGVGDRHLENIMVSKKGYLFHIDYGFIIGAEPRRMRYPSMRITKDMVDALGGPDSQHYEKFVKLAKDIHLCLQKRLPLFFTLLQLLVTIEPPIMDKQLTEDTLINELIYRFMYGETYDQSAIQLSVHISNSSSSYNQSIMDFFHYHSRENTIGTILNSTVSWVSSLF